MNAFELAEDLQRRTSFSREDALGLAHVMTNVVDHAKSELVTRDYLDARLAEFRTEFRTDLAALDNKLTGKISGLQVEMHQGFRTQTIWTASSIFAAAGLMAAVLKLFP